jgi:hypothetical protein
VIVIHGLTQLTAGAARVVVGGAGADVVGFGEPSSDDGGGFGEFDVETTIARPTTAIKMIEKATASATGRLRRAGRRDVCRV